MKRIILYAPPMLKDEPIESKREKVLDYLHRLSLLINNEPLDSHIFDSINSAEYLSYKTASVYAEMIYSKKMLEKLISKEVI